MKLALLSDIHGNLQALEACLAHARSQQVQRFAFLGDLVGYGAQPGAVVDRIMLLNEEGAIVLRGNHDELALAPPVEAKTVGESTALWTHQALSHAQRGWLASLPYTFQQDSLLLVHATANEPEKWRYAYDERAAAASLDAASTQYPGTCYVFGGHVHEQSLYYRGLGAALMKFVPQAGIGIPVPKRRQWLGTVGSVGQPRDGIPKAMYAVIDVAQARLTFHRVTYDHHGAAAAIRKAGLPEFFAERLEKGR